MRPTWDETWLTMCEVLAERSTCWKHKTATVIADENNRAVAMAYNGTPAGEPHCCDVSPRDPVEHRQWSKDHEAHAEMNALLYLARRPQTWDPARSTLYTLLSPCLDCAKAIFVVGIGRVVISNIHRQEGANYLRARGVRVELLAVVDDT